MALEQWTVSRKLQEHSCFIPDVFLALRDEMNVQLKMERPPHNQEVWGYWDDPIGDSFMVHQSESLTREI